VVAGGSLGILIPPSVIFIIYGIATEQSIGKLFAAGILPGILLSLLFCIAIMIWAHFRPEIAPPGGKNEFQKEGVSPIRCFRNRLTLFACDGRALLGYFHPD